MNDPTEAALKEIASLLESHDQILVLGHKDPDGDTLGSSLAWTEAMRSQGRRTWLLVPSPLPPNYSFLPGWDQINHMPGTHDHPRLVFFFDAGNMARSGDMVKQIRKGSVIVNVDHHISNPSYGHVNLIEPDTSACAQVVLRLLDYLGVEVTATMATNLYTALMTDTGGFRHENTNAKALEDGARMVWAGAKPGFIAERIYKSDPPSTVRLRARALADLKVDAEGDLVWSSVTKQMLEDCQATIHESESIIDELNSVKGTRLAILFKQVDERRTKVSIRTKGNMDASRLAQEFGGGGHLRAAGCEIAEPVEQAVGHLLAAAHAALGSSGLRAR